MEQKELHVWHLQNNDILHNKWMTFNKLKSQLCQANEIQDISYNPGKWISAMGQ